MEIKTHEEIDENLCGRAIEVGSGYAKVLLEVKPQMRADSKGLVHGGFLFSAADYAAMIAVNEPNVVLAGANVRFLKPVAVGDSVLFTAEVKGSQGKKRLLKVKGEKEGQIVFEGEFVAVVPQKHVLER